MNTVNYQTNSTSAQNGQYPVTIQGLDFIQNQIMCLQNLALTAGSRYILREPDASGPGVAVIDGEVIPLVGTSRASGYINVKSETDTIRTDSGDYQDVRVKRTAEYSLTEAGTESYARTSFRQWRTNTELWEALSGLLAGGFGIPYRTETLNRHKLDACLTPARLAAADGSSFVCGYGQYSIEVYALGGGCVYQELTGSDFRRWGRYYDPAYKTWGEFAPLDTRLTLEAKVINTNEIRLRHGFLPPYVRILLLRKKSRSMNSGYQRPQRPRKLGWYHSWSMILTKGTPNDWYVPKVEYAYDNGSRPCEGYELADALKALVLRQVTDPKGNRFWRLNGVDQCWRKHRYGYAKFAVALVGSRTFNLPPFAVARMKMRLSRYVAGQPVITYSVD